MCAAGVLKASSAGLTLGASGPLVSLKRPVIVRPVYRFVNSKNHNILAFVLGHAQYVGFIVLPAPTPALEGWGL
jgi:hypothetical protein